MSDLLADVRDALRSIARRPGFSLVVALTLALGVGLNATVFGMMDAMLLRPFRFSDQDRLVILWERTRGTADRDPVAAATFRDWREQLTAVESPSAWTWWDATLGRADAAERLQGFRVSSGFFDVLGVPPSMGRSFAAAEEQHGQHRVVVIGHGLWQQRFGADRHVVGTSVLLNGESHTVIGVAPPGFDFPAGAELWAPLALPPDRLENRDERYLTVVARVAPGRSAGDVQTEMDLVAARLAREYPDAYRDRVVTVQGLAQAFREASAFGLFGMLLAAAALVLLVACMNIAGLLIARVVDRQRELALRSALGATRGRIARHLVTETVVLAVLSSVLAVALSAIGLDLLRVSLPADITRYIEGWGHLGLDWRLAVVIPAFAVVVGLLVGVAPAVAAIRENSAETLKDGGRGPLGGGRQRTRQVLVVAEIAFAIALLVAAGLTVTGGIRLVTQPGGFDVDRLLTLHVDYPDDRHVDESARHELTDTLLSRLAAVPGIERAAAANILPALGYSPSVHVEIDGQPVVDTIQRPRVGYRAISSGYFDAMRIPIVSGRAFTTTDREGTQPVAIVSASTAGRFWPGADPVGRRLRIDGPRQEWLTVVGVAGDVQMYNWWDGVDFSAVYRPLRQVTPPGRLHVAMRAHGDAGRLATPVREVVLAVNPRLTADRVRTMRQAIDEGSRTLRWLASLMAICGAIGAVLAVLGIYSLMAYAVSQRAHEFGVRMALGASHRAVLGLTLRQAAGLTTVGLAVGAVLALLAGGLLGNAMQGLIELEARVFAVVLPGLAVVALAAAYLPARRTLRVDPVAILRQ